MVAGVRASKPMPHQRAQAGHQLTRAVQPRCIASGHEEVEGQRGPIVHGDGSTTQHEQQATESGGQSEGDEPNQNESVGKRPQGLAGVVHPPGRRQPARQGSLAVKVI